MKMLLPNEIDFAEYENIIHKGPLNFIRCNTLKISPDELLLKLRKKWDIEQPYPNHKEIMLVKNELLPGELGNAIEHLLGYYYIQEVSSMMSAIALSPSPGESVIDLMASPGSKTTQIASLMQNTGNLIANDVKLDRIMILASNLEKNGVSNCIVLKHDAVDLCERLIKKHYKFDKILLDVPCSGEGTLRSSAKTFLMWNPKMIKNLGRMQKKFIANALKLLKKDGILVYSTCTHAPEENESVISFALDNFPVEVQKVSLPLKTRSGITKWKEDTYNKQVENCHRIYPQDNDSEGFFVCKLKLKEEIKD